MSTTRNDTYTTVLGTNTITVERELLPEPEPEKIADLDVDSLPDDPIKAQALLSQSAMKAMRATMSAYGGVPSRPSAIWNVTVTQASAVDGKKRVTKMQLSDEEMTALTRTVSFMSEPDGHRVMR